MGRYAKGDPVKTGTGQPGDRTIGLAMQDQRHRTRPERISKRARRCCFNAKFKRRIHCCHMADQRIEGWPAFRGKNGSDRIAIAGIAAKPIDGFRGKGHKPAGAQNVGCAVNRIIRQCKAFCVFHVLTTGIIDMPYLVAMRCGCSAKQIAIQSENMPHHAMLKL